MVALWLNIAQTTAARAHARFRRNLVALEPKTHMTSSKPKELTASERMFVGEYLVDFNATAALMRCGWSPHSANNNAVYFLRKPHVRAAIEQGMKRMEAHSVISATRILEEVLRIATADPRRAMNEDGSMKPLQELDEDTARAVASIEVVTKPGRGEEPPTITHKLKFWDKGRATDTLLKSLGKLLEGPQVTTNVINAGPGALEAARLRELENQLRQVLGQPLLEDGEAPAAAEEVSNAPAEAPDDDTIEAAQPADGTDLDDPAFL
jgi:phage terminase small subunit